MNQNKECVLAGDIGGTNLRLAVFAKTRSKAKMLVKKECKTGTNAEIFSIIRGLLNEARSRFNAQVNTAVLSVAGPVSEDRQRVKLTNIKVDLSAQVLKTTLKSTSLSEVTLINDMEAFAFGILTNPKTSQVAIPGIKMRAPEQHANKAVIAAGTGLGEGILAWTGTTHVPVASEACHALLTAVTQEQKEFVEYLTQEQGYHPDTESALSGRGLVSIHAFLRKKGLKGKDVNEAAIISSLGLKGEDPACKRALDVFMEFYAQETISLGFRAKATGGIYIGGRIALENAKKFHEKTFGRHYASLYDKKRGIFELVKSMPVFLVLDEDINLQGAAYAAFHHTF